MGSRKVRSSGTANQLTSQSDDLYEPALVLAYAPPFGWDNAVDVEVAKQFCRDAMYVAAIPSEASERAIREVAWRLYCQGISSSLAASLIDSLCHSAYSRGEIQAIVNHAYKIIHTVPGTNSLAGGAARFNPWQPLPDEDELEAHDPLSLEPDGPAVWPKPVNYNAKENAAKNAEMFLVSRPRRIISSDGVLYSLERKAWRPISDGELAAEIRATDPDHVNDVGRVRSMVSATHHAQFTHARPFDWISKPVDAPDPNDTILFRNGIFNFATGELLPHTGQFFATALPTYDFDPSAKCRLWLEKLDEWLDPSFHPTLQEFAGYSMTPDTRCEVLLAMIGATRGGKGTITRVLQSLVGSEHFASRTLNDLGSDFGLEGTLDKRVILIPDAHDADLSKRSAALERIKAITGNDHVSVNRKGMPILNAKVPAKIVLVANKHPKFLDESGALNARELVLIFENSFRDRMDPDLRTKLLAESSGIANWALEGLRRLRANGLKFTIGEHGRRASRELAEAQSPALRFANSRLIVTGSQADYVGLGDAHDEYTVWARDIERLSLREVRGRNDFKDDLLAALMPRGVRYGVRKIKGRTRRGLFGIRFKR